MILAADGQFALQSIRGRCQRGVRVAATDHGRRPEPGLACHRIGKIGAGRQDFVANLNGRRGGGRARLVDRDDPGHGLPVELHEFRRHQRLVVHDRPGIVLARDIGGRQHGDDPLHRARPRCIDAEDARMRMRRLHRVHAEHAGRRELLVGIDGATSDMSDRAFMALDATAAHASCSATNLANRFAHSARR